MTPSTTSPAAATARTPGYPATLVDHSWLVSDGILFCVAGSAHTTTAVAGCAYWIRDDLAAGIATFARPAHAPPARPLTFRAATYRKLPTLADPADWPTVHNRLSERGITALPASLLAAFDPATVPDSIDPAPQPKAPRHCPPTSTTAGAESCTTCTPHSETRWATQGCSV
jgi:hypothetical protein